MLSITGLTKTYAGGVRALDGIDIEIPKGLFGLLGPNGAGKSTLMRTIATLQDADAGTIRFDGIDIVRDRMALQRRLGYLPQEFGTYPRVSAQEMLRHFAALKGIHGAGNRAAVDELLVRTNLWDARTRSVDTFSGGMRQRFGIAQALLGDPDLLIVDEPTAGLDPVERRRFQNLLSAVGEDVVVILSTHIVEDVAALCPRVAIMAAGRILKQGDPHDLAAELQGRLWSGMVDKGAVAAPPQIISTRRLAGRTEMRILAEQSPPGFTAAVPTLEDVYFQTLIDHGIDIQAE
ncbi:ABC transporter ATP-binding protein [Niveispirillum sp. KHB5.9]|uniref:ABC transporter ATP-binding protein n=1 Tax=Niveispirillum sp. KHB5.9 TaxID=3400269 RepID=UPI003A83C631